MSDANRTAVGITKEATFGVTPATPPFEALRVTGSDLNYTPRTAVSAEIRADRQVPDLIRLGFEAGGRLPFEVAYGSIDTELEGGLYSTWSARWLTKINTAAGTPITGVTASTGVVLFTGGTAVAGELFRLSNFNSILNNVIAKATAGGAGTVTFGAGILVDDASPPTGARLKKIGEEFGATVLSTGANTLIRTTGSWITLGLIVGEWIKIGGATAGTQFNTAGCNGFARISIVTALTLTFDIMPTGFGVDAGTAKTIRVYYGEYIRNGVTAASYSIEEQFQDLVTPEYQVFTGMRVGTLSLEAATQAILTGSVEFLGANATISTARTAGATDVPAQPTDVLNSSSNVGRIAENGAVVTGNYVMSMGLQISNSLRRLNQLGNLASFGIGAGRCIVTGRLGTYYESKALLDKLRAGTATSYDTRFTDSDGSRHLLIDLPRIKFASGDPTVPGIDSDRMLDLNFQAIRHPVLGYTINTQRFEGTEG